MYFLCMYSMFVCIYECINVCILYIKYIHKLNILGPKKFPQKSGQTHKQTQRLGRKTPLKSSHSKRLNTKNNFLETKILESFDTNVKPIKESVRDILIQMNKKM